MSKISKIAIFCIVFTLIFFTIPNLSNFFEKKEIINENSYEEVANIQIPIIDSYEINKKIEKIFEEKNLIKKEWTFYREYDKGLHIYNFNAVIIGDKDDIFNISDEITQIEDVFVSNLAIQKNGDKYQCILDFGFVGKIK